jgi:hypothetical protein
MHLTYSDLDTHTGTVSIANAGAGAPETEIEITPQMVEAGVDALASRYFDLVDSYGYPEIVRTVFGAMVAKIEKPRRGDDQIA